MKKIFFFLLFVLFFVFPRIASAATINFSWKDNRNLNVSGIVNGLLTQPNVKDNRFVGDVSGFKKCNYLAVIVDFNANTATIDNNAQVIGKKGLAVCTSSILGVSDTTPIQNPFPNIEAGETQQQKRVDITLRSPKKSDQSPQSVIITVKDSEGTIKTAPNIGKSCTTGDCNTGAVEYKTNINLDPGTYNVCFSSFEPCHDFEKKIREQLNLYYGESSLGREINVLIETHDKITTGSPYSVSPYTVELKKDGTVVNKCTTNEVKQPPLPGEADAIGSKKDITVSQRCSMDDVGEGKYQICKTTGSLECKDVEKIAGTPLSVNFNVEACGIGLNGNAEDCAPDETPKKAPPPPCAKEGEVPCKSFRTPFGIVSTKAEDFLNGIFATILSLSGGIALLLIIRAGYKIMTSQGNPEAIKEGREQLIAAIVGLLFLIFSFVLLQLIGVDILRIPGLSGTSGEGKQCDLSSGKNPCDRGFSCTSQGGPRDGGVCTRNSDNPLPVKDPPPPPSISSCEGKALKLNYKDDCVRTLQRALGIDEDGIYGPDTAEAVIRFQTNGNLVIDGVVGPCTWGALKGNGVPDSCNRYK